MPNLTHNRLRGETYLTSGSRRH